MSLSDHCHLRVPAQPARPSVRTVINLEGMAFIAYVNICTLSLIDFAAAGTTGPELLFQATSEQMIKAYAKVPR